MENLKLLKILLQGSAKKLRIKNLFLTEMRHDTSYYIGENNLHLSEDEIKHSLMNYMDRNAFSLCQRINKIMWQLADSDRVYLFYSFKEDQKGISFDFVLAFNNENGIGYINNKNIPTFIRTNENENLLEQAKKLCFDLEKFGFVRENISNLVSYVWEDSE